jgi:hypothetical protein
MHGDGKRPDDGDDGEVDEDGEIAVQWQNQNVVMENALARPRVRAGTLSWDRSRSYFCKPLEQV